MIYGTGNIGAFSIMSTAANNLAKQFESPISALFNNNSTIGQIVEMNSSVQWLHKLSNVNSNIINNSTGISTLLIELKKAASYQNSSVGNLVNMRLSMPWLHNLSNINNNGFSNLAGVATLMSELNSDFEKYRSLFNAFEKISPVWQMGNALTLNTGLAGYDNVMRQWSPPYSNLINEHLKSLDFENDISENDYNDAVHAIEHNQDLRAAITNTLEEIAETGKFEDVEGWLLQVLSPYVKDRRTLVVLLFIIMAMIASIPNVAVDYIFGSDTDKIIEHQNKLYQRANEHADSLFQTHQQSDTPLFNLKVRSDSCIMYLKNSTKSKTVCKLNEGAEVAVIQEFRKWSKVQIRLDSVFIKGFIKSDNLSDE